MHLLIQHPLGALLISYMLFAGIVGGMPTPQEFMTLPLRVLAYTWAYRTLNIWSQNAVHAIKEKFPQIQQDLPPGSVQLTATQSTTVVPKE